MSATDELRRMLDERGVAHSDHYLSTTWRDRHGMLHLAGEPMADGLLVVDMLTPEQAIAVTLGELNTRAERTCHIEMYPMGLHEEDGEAPICSACRVAIDEDVYYCPNCGAKVVEE